MSEEKEFTQPAIPRFNGHYDHWAMLMENLLRSKGFWKLVQSGYDEPQEEEEMTEAQRKQLEEIEQKDQKIKNYLFQAIDRTILEQILEKRTSKDIWESMKKKYAGSARVKRAALQALRRDWEIMEMKVGETITEYFARVMSLSNKMRSNGEDMKDVMVVEKILRTLIEKFNYVVVSIEESKDIDSLTIDELQSSLVVHEQKFNRTSTGYNGEEQALKITVDDRNKAGRGRGSYRGRGRSRGRGQQQGYSRATLECYRCHKLGHFQYDCPNWDKQVNYVELNEEEDMLLMAYVEDAGATREDMWYLDSGCSNHMCGSKVLFTELNDSFQHTVKLGNNAKMKVSGKGNIRMEVKGVSCVIGDVYYVPELKNNLLSIGQLQERGFTIIIRSGTCKIYHPQKGLVIESNMTANRMFVLLANTPNTTDSNQEVCFNTSSQELPFLWHCRLGHIGTTGLKTLQQKHLVHGLPQFTVPDATCVDCLRGKQHREPIPKRSTWRATQRLELIHADLCGPISPVSNSNKKYVMCLIDDYSRKAWSYFLNEKSEAFGFFKIFKLLVEKETDLAIKCLRTDRGGEFTSTEFNSFCKDNGIKRQLTTAYTPQQNGVAERKNRSIMNSVRCMLSEKGVPKPFWPEAVKWSVYVLNRCPTTALKDTTPEEVWSGVKPSIAHLRVFGSLCHVHIPDVKRVKLDDKSFSGVFLGISDESKGYRIYNPMTKKVSTSRDVVFEEKTKWNWDKSYDQQIIVDLEWGDDEVDDTENDSEGEDSPNVEQGGVGEEALESPSANVEGRRHRRPPVWMNDYESGEGLSEEESDMNFALFTNTDPVSFEEAVHSPEWQEAMANEIKSIEKNETWELTDLPKGAKRIGVKWVYKTKLNELGEIEKFKARLVAKGYVQEHGIDYSEVFAPVARMDTVRIVLALAAHNGWPVHQLDVKSAFLHGELLEDVYVDQPKGFTQQEYPEKVYKLRKALYGLKQAPRAWFSRIEGYFLREGFEKCPSEQTLFVKTNDTQGTFLIVSLYVDDLVYTGNDDTMEREFKASMMKEFDMSDLGKMRYFLGLEVQQLQDGIFVSQKKYAVDVLRRFGMENSKAVHNPIVPGFKISKDESGVAVDSTFYKQLVGSLMYLTSTRPDLMYAVSLIARYMAQPTELHLMAAKRVLRYVKGTVGLGILYKRGAGTELVAYTDSDYAGCLEDRKSTSGYAFLLGSGAVAWSSKKQPIVTLSTTEAEFVAATACACQAIWMKRILKMLGCEGNKCTTIYCDNSSTIKLSKNLVMHGRSKHIGVRFHFLRDLSKEGTVELIHCGTQDQLADVFTKPLKLEQFLKLRELLGVCDLPEVN